MLIIMAGACGMKLLFPSCGCQEYRDRVVVQQGSESTFVHDMIFRYLSLTQ